MAGGMFRGAERLGQRLVAFPDPAEWAPVCLRVEAGASETVVWGPMVRWRPVSARMTRGLPGRQALGPCLLPRPTPSCGPRGLTPLPLGTPILRAWILASSFGSPGGHEVFDTTASDARWALGAVHVRVRGHHLLDISLQAQPSWCSQLGFPLWLQHVILLGTDISI